MTYYFVVNEGEVIRSFLDEEEAEGFAECKCNDAVDETIRADGFDPEELDIDEVGEFAIKSGFDGGYYYSDKVEINDNTDMDAEFETSEGDIICYGDILEVLEK